jgi:RNA polymerase sigma factor for flagellar operon FliA
VKTQETIQEELIEGCITLVHHLARQYVAHNSAVSLEDLIGEGYIGLVQAAKKFEFDRGVKFSTFATTRIRGAMMDSLRRDRPLSRPMAEKVTRLQTTHEELSERLGRPPTEPELARKLSVSPAKLREIRRMRALRVTSLDVQVDELHQEVQDDSDSPEQMAVTAMLKRELRGHVARLIPRDREIIERVYWQRQKHSQVAYELGISESRVSQLQSRALARLQSMMAEDDAVSAA